MIYTNRQKKKDILLIILIALLIVLLILGGIYLFRKSPASVKNQDGGATNKSGTTGKSESTPVPTPTPTPYKYINEEGQKISTRFNAPEGFTKVEVEEGSFAEYLRNLPLKPYTDCALLWDKTINDSAPWHGVIKQDICDQNTQQCVDTVIRLWAEYLFANERYEEISFDFFTTPVFHCDFVTWASGQRVKIVNNKPIWYENENVQKDDYSYENLTKYLEYVYMYANTNSYKMQTTKISYDDLSIGDMIIAVSSELNKANPDLGASLGHAMIIVDMAVNAEGEKVYLIAEGNTPATQPYIISSDKNGYGGIWVKMKDGIYHSYRGVNFPEDSFRRLG